MSSPLISFIIPYFISPYLSSREENLTMMLESLDKQTFKNVEVIISGDIYESKFKGLNVRNIYNDTRNIRLGRMLNLGVENSIGEYIHICETDFVFPEDHCEKLSQRLNPNKFLYFNFYDREGRLKPNGTHDIIYIDGQDGFFHRSKSIPFEEAFLGLYVHFYPLFIRQMMKSGLKFEFQKDMEIKHIMKNHDGKGIMDRATESDNAFGLMQTILFVEEMKERLESYLQFMRYRHGSEESLIERKIYKIGVDSQ